MNIDCNRITLRKAELQDINILIEYRIRFLSETYGTPSPERIAYLKESLKDYFNRTLKDNSFISWIAEYEGQSVGFSGLVIRHQPGNFEVPNGRTGYILNMYTMKNFRKKGICKSLLTKLIEEAKKLDLDRIELNATVDGESVYRQFGFKEPHDKALELILE
jgi:ribosomal protein S18 acetylase RimI-like enzyme